MKNVVGAGLLASAFAPLVALLAILKLNALQWTGWIIFAGCLASFVLLYFVLRSLSRVQARPVEVIQVTHEDERVLGFAASYVVPVVVAAFSGDDVTSLLATSALTLLMMIIYVRAGLYHLNPTLAILGYRLYKITSTSGASTMLLTKGAHIAQQGVVECRYLGDGVAIQLKGRS
ncbi:hypothetical protein ABS642_13325 [Microbacterium sp. A8/3-1]|uniref:Uncharacterized protein n=1 Tax=Microbacterium sp. A8/3-1 TaxID=3160749 RepID=A0AAU7VSV4_9MICO